jgi:hypothetical protein
MTLLVNSIVVWAEKPIIDVFKSPSCNCCVKWENHLEENGFNVISHSTDNMSYVKAKLGIKGEIQSCHTGVINGKFIEGHVPASDIKKLISSKSNIKGLSVPQMQSGQNVPGMETREGNAVYNVLSVSDDGISVFAHYE